MFREVPIIIIKVQGDDTVDRVVSGSMCTVDREVSGSGCTVDRKVVVIFC